MLKIRILIFALFLFNNSLMAQSHTEIINLYKDVPGSKKSNTYTEDNVKRANGTLSTSKVTTPTLTYYQATGSQKTKAAVIICPGGGYSGLAISHEGYDVAEKFASAGINAFVLKYRLPNDEIMADRKIGPLQDAQQSVKHLRENAAKYNIDPNKIGILGFSAGGHLASTASTHFNRIVIENKSGISVRPDFSVLIYPVITFGEQTNKGTKKNLIGEDASQDLIDLYSNEKQVSKETPITFIVHANDDKTVPVDNALDFIKALNRNGVKNEAHIYPSGGHGFGLNNTTTKDVWFERLITWMDDNKLL